MRKLTFSELAHNPGIPFKFTLVSSDGHEHDNFFMVKFREAYIGTYHGKAELLYKDAWHLFTENEFVDAAERYYEDQDCLHTPPNDIQRDRCTGYISPVTYENKSGALTTRFLVRFNATPISDLSNNLYFGLFSAREIKRARERVEMYVANGFSFWKYIASWFAKMFCKD